jgi:hypothetical protein
MDNDLKKLWKEASWSNVRLYPRICMEGLKNHGMPHPGYVTPGQDSNKHLQTEAQKVPA